MVDSSLAVALVERAEERDEVGVLKPVGHVEIGERRGVPVGAVALR
jgi:hypothetical protein